MVIMMYLRLEIGGYFENKAALIGYSISRATNELRHILQQMYDLLETMFYEHTGI